MELSDAMLNLVAFPDEKDPSVERLVTIYKDLVPDSNDAFQDGGVEEATQFFSWRARL